MIRKWGLRLGVALSSPLIFLALMEAALRLAGFGYPTGFFLPGDDGFVSSNERFAWRFMPPVMAREPLALRFARPKPAGTLRIFIFGDSAAQGIPAPPYGFGRILEAMLRARHPGRRFEMLNTAVTGINSHAAREAVLDSLRYEPDLLLIYCGNNEVVGPFGPGTVFQSGTPGLRTIRLRLGLSRLRIGQALTRLLRPFLRPKTAPKQWAGPEMFLEHRVGPDDPGLERVYAHFRVNIADMLSSALSRRVPVVMCTVPVNLEACPPFASQHRQGLAEADARRWDALYALGKAAQARGDQAAAERHYREAQGIDPLYAELDFRRAQCLAALGRGQESAQEYALARDHDVLRMRADSRLNTVARESARAAGPLVRLYDAEVDLASRQNDLFYEHVHMTFAGNYRLARGFLEQVEGSLPALGEPSGPVPSEEDCARALAFTRWSRWTTDKEAVDMMQRPPFTMQLGHEAAVARWNRSLEEGRKAAFAPEELRRTAAAYAQALRERPDDYLLHEVFSALLEQCGDFGRALSEAQTLAALQPGNAQPIQRIGLVLLHGGKVDEAVRLFRELAKLRPERVEAYQALGDALLARGSVEDSLSAYRAALERGGDSPRLHSGLAALSLRQGDLDGAVAHWSRAVESLDEPRWRANLAGVLFMQERYDEALAQLRKAVAALPDDAGLRVNFGQALMAVGETAQAQVQFRKARQLDPGILKSMPDLEQSPAPR